MRPGFALPALLLLSACVIADESTAPDHWEMSVGEDPTDYAVVATLRQSSATSIKDEYATKDVIPVLELRCSPGDPSITARIDWGRFISSFNTEIGFKVDDGKRLWLKWGVDRTEKVTISPSAADSAKLIEVMMAGDLMEVEISPYSEGPVTAAYQLSGFAAATETLRESCR